MAGLEFRTSNTQKIWWFASITKIGNQWLNCNFYVQQTWSWKQRQNKCKDACEKQIIVCGSELMHKENKQNKSGQILLLQELHVTLETSLL